MSQSTFMKRFFATAIGSVLLGMAVAAGTPASAAPAGDIVDREVAFTVRNTNTSGVPCPTDGAAYQVRGHLTGPAGKLASTSAESVSLYLHGLELGEWFWRFGDAPGYNHVREMAAQGHVSVAIDRIGYGSSGQPPGLLSCVGGQADITHQIVQQLRSGRYTAPEGAVAFKRVALLGHSLGGAIAQVATYSYGDVDALGVLSYSDLALSGESLMGTLSWGANCLTGGRRSVAGAPGYAYLTPSLASYQDNFLAQSPPDVRGPASALRGLNPCADMATAAEATAIDLTRLGQVTVPVLTVVGGRDRVFDVDRARLQGNLFTGTHDVTTHVIDQATHGLTLEPTAVEFRHVLGDWLTARGF
ncbi:alpha/beta hydrolase [Nocardia beijingensis]|uniref:alpha/beta hydrolase n=1 Tax=Nocardia beijingensis TaxID=95162 RepID=UPI0033F6E110